MFLLLTAIVFCVQLSEISTEYGKLSRQKCEEYYSKAVQTNIAKSACKIQSKPYVRGIHKEEYPHVVLIGYGNEPNVIELYAHGGSLISELFVLTAASSVEHGPPPQQILKGMTYAPMDQGKLTFDEINPENEYDYYLDEYGNYHGLERECIEEVIRYPDDDGSHIRHIRHDIALLRLRDRVEFTSYFRPACLNTGMVNPNLAAGTAAYIGYKVMRWQEHDLLKLSVQLVSREKCDTLQGSQCDMVDEDARMCTKDKSNIYPYYYGYPIHVVMNKPLCMYSIVSVYGYRTACGHEKKYVVHMNVSYYIPWIEEVVWRRNY